MKIIYIKETEETCDIIKRLILKVKRFLNIINVENKSNNTIYYLPIFKDSKISKYRIKRLVWKINNLLEKEGCNSIVLSEYLCKNLLFKNYLCSENINILDGRFLFKCLTNNVIKYIFKLKKREVEFRRNFITNK
ncbi:MAG: hypothetical protein IJE59_04220 [Clostridia bacterium]|nr:hypothetical protein [Clostridia bacterium]